MTKRENFSDDIDIKANKYLTFMLREEVYGVEISRIKEVLEYVEITKIPGAPEFMKGVINLRGGIVPVADLRTRFNLEQVSVTVETCIIILEVMIEDESILLGAVADSVREVVEIPEEDIEPPPSVGSGINVQFLKGMGRYGGNFFVLLDIDKLFGELGHEVEDEIC